MYWIFIIIFIIGILIPDIIRGPVYFLAEERAEEIAIFIMGTVAFLVFIRNELQLTFHRKQKEKDEKRISQTVKDLVESYSYIGEVNRKMDILMNIALGLSERSALDKKREKEIYDAIVSAANFLMKADATCLRFINADTLKTEKEIKMSGHHHQIKNNELMNGGQDNNYKKEKDYLIISSSQKINNIKSYIIITGYDKEEESNPKNIEILKVFASQAIFLYSYINLSEKTDNN